MGQVRAIGAITGTLLFLSIMLDVFFGITYFSDLFLKPIFLIVFILVIWFLISFFNLNV